MWPTALNAPTDAARFAVRRETAEREEIEERAVKARPSLDHGAVRAAARPRVDSPRALPRLDPVIAERLDTPLPSDDRLRRDADSLRYVPPPPRTRRVLEALAAPRADAAPALARRDVSALELVLPRPSRCLRLLCWRAARLPVERLHGASALLELTAVLP